MTTDEPFTLENAWAQLADLLAMMIALFGAPATLAARKVLGKDLRQQIIAWLAPLEALVRRLLFLDAKNSPLANLAAPAPRAPIASAMGDGAPVALSDNSAEWRGRFNVWPRGAGPRPSRQASPCPGIAGARPRGPNLNAVPLAKRLEALIRVVKDRRACVARLARKLSARATEVRAAFAPYRHRAPMAQSLLLETQMRVNAALADTS